jgi:hypothetical protein
MSSTGDPSVRPAHGEAAPAVPLWLQARLDELVDQATTARAVVATGGAWRESLAALAATEDLADDLQHAVVDELRAHAPKAWSWSAIGRALGVTPQAAHTRFAERARARRRKRPATPQEPGAAATSTPPPAPVPPAPAAIAPHPDAPPATERHQDMLTAAEVPAASTTPTDTTTPASRPPTPARPRRRGAAKEAAYELVRSGDHTESHRWYVLADGERIGWVQPEYGATGRRKGWSGVMANMTRAALSGQAAVVGTREAAAVQVIESWQQMRSRGASRRRQLEEG